MKKTKAERIFEATRWECKKHYEHWGLERNPDGQAVGFNGLITDDESVCTRTFNAVQKFIDQRVRLRKEFQEVLGTDESAELEVLEMVQATLNNARRNYMI